MEKTPFLGAENELQKIYSNLGVMVPVGDLSQGKAPAVQPLPTEVTNDTITFNFNVMSNADITEISYSTDHMDEGTITPKKGKISISFDRDPNDTLYEIGITVTNENGSTYVGQLAEFPIIPNWATANEVLEGNKFIGEDGQEAVGTLVPEEGPEGLNYLGIPVFEYSVSEDPETGENVIDYARLVEGSHARASEWAEAGLGAIDSYQIFYKWTTNDGQGNIDGTLLEWLIFDSIDDPEATYIDLSSVLNADALANGDYFLEAYELITYNGVEYATECVTYPVDVAEGGPVIQSGQLEITENGENDVTGYDSVYVDVLTGPGTGGATVQSCTMEYVQEGGLDIPRHTIVLDTMPADIDPENNHYAVQVFALCYNSTSADPFNSPDIEHLANISGTEPAEFDLANNTIYDYYCGIPQDQDFQDIASTSGYVVLYEGSLTNPIYKWPCTITTPTNPQP